MSLTETSIRPAAPKPRRRSGRPPAPRPDDAGQSDAAAVILNAALDLFAERNFSSVTIKDIATASGLNTALIYYYFGSKEELFRRSVTMAVDQAFAQFDTGRAAITSPEDVILEWLETHILAYSSIRRLIKISIDYANAANPNGTVDQAVRRFYKGEQDLLLASLEKGIADGLFRPIDASQTALFISTYLDGVIVRSVILSEFDYAAAIREMKTFLQSYLRRV